jgi:hypothetical protein
MAKPDPSTDGSQTQAGNKGLMALPVKLPHHPVVLEEQAQRAADIQLRIADRITAFAGSMNFVYLHVVLSPHRVGAGAMPSAASKRICWSGPGQVYDH